VVDPILRADGHFKTSGGKRVELRGRPLDVILLINGALTFHVIARVENNYPVRHSPVLSKSYRIEIERFIMAINHAQQRGHLSTRKLDLEGLKLEAYGCTRKEKKCDHCNGIRRSWRRMSVGSWKVPNKFDENNNLHIKGVDFGSVFQEKAEWLRESSLNGQCERASAFLVMLRTKP
jgi:hypothetical protein